MLIHFTTPEADATLDAAHYPVPAKGSIVVWEFRTAGPNPLPIGRYRVDEVVWHYGINQRVTIYMTPTA